MIIFILTIIIVIFLLSIYLTDGKRGGTITFFFLFTGVSIIYFFKGNIESFLFYKNNEIIVEDIVNSDDGLENLSKSKDSCTPVVTSPCIFVLIADLV